MVVLFFGGGGDLSIFVVEQGLFSGAGGYIEGITRNVLEAPLFGNLSLLIGSNTHPTY